MYLKLLKIMSFIFVCELQKKGRQTLKLVFLIVNTENDFTNVDQAIPIQEVYDDGIFLVGRNLWSKTFSFTDINYAVASKEDKEGMFLGYSEILNSLDSGATTKITINNRRIQKSRFEEML